MGCYINPRGKTKEEWLAENAAPFNIVNHATLFNELKERGLLPVCLVNNGFFTAAAIGFSASEIEAFVRPNDERPKKWFVADISKLLEVEPSLQEYLDHS